LLFQIPVQVEAAHVVVLVRGTDREEEAAALGHHPVVGVGLDVEVVPRWIKKKGNPCGFPDAFAVPVC